MTVTLKIIYAEQTIDLRHKVLWPDHPRDSVMIAEDHQATHFGAFDQDTLLGVGSFFSDGPSVRLRKLAVDPHAQGRGIASQLIATACAHFSSLGKERLWCDARLSAKDFYVKNGFDVSDTVFVKKNLDYVSAERLL